MLTLRGQVVNLFETPKGVNRDGNEYGGNTQVQLMADVPLPNGHVRREIVTLRCDCPEDFNNYLNEWVEVPVGAFAPAKNQLVFFMRRGSRPMASLSTAGGHSGGAQ